MWRCCGILLAALFSACTCAAQQGDSSTDPEAQEAEIARLVAAGAIDQLETRLRGRPPLEQLPYLARAQVNRALQARDAEARHRGLAEAERRYQAWIEAAESESVGEPVQRAVAQAAARADFGAMILTRWAATDLDEYEISAGQRGERARLIGLLSRARSLLEQAAALIQPLLQELGRGEPGIEDRYLSLGVYDELRMLEIEVDYHLAWANLYLGIVDGQNVEVRSTALRASERSFRRLADLGAFGDTTCRVHLGLAMTLREQHRFDEAEREFETALEGAEPGCAAQVRYERARGQFRQGRFEKARDTLRPLVETDPEKLPAGHPVARFYVNLAHLWEANSYLLEAEALRRSAEGAADRTALLRQAQQARETGLIRMNRLAGRGGPWPGVVQLYISAGIRLDAPPGELGSLELLFAARHLSGQKRYAEALRRLQEAAGRQPLGADLAGEIRFEIGVCHYRLGELPEAAAAFELVAASFRSHEKAEQAATFAYQLRARLARDSGRPEDYSQLADALLLVLRHFPRHEQRGMVLWWLPVALQSAQRYSEAAEHFARLPRDSPDWEEAQYRRLLCLRLALEGERERLGRAEFAQRAVALARELRRHAREALERADSTRQPQALRNWSALSTVSAAELLASPGVEQFQSALDVLADFEAHYAGHESLGRVLTVQIRAYRGLRQFEAAARLVERYLKTEPAEKAGPVLASLAAGMQEEVQRLLDEGRQAEARRLAADSLATFEQLDQWTRARDTQHAQAAAISFALVQAQHLAGQYQAALTRIQELLAADPRNGNYLRLRALILSDSLGSEAPEAQLTAAREAWEALLADPGLIEKAPQRYWEARYHQLRLLLRSGRADEVEKAIRAERVWRPELGGTAWRERFERLYAEAAAAARGAGGNGS